MNKQRLTLLGEDLLIIYIGNALSRHGIAPTAADVLPSLFRAEGYRVTVASGYRNMILRLMHMLVKISVNARVADVLLIDVYSTRNFWYAFTCSFLCRLLGIPYIPILHGGDFPKRMDSSPRSVRALLSNAFQIVVPSPYLAGELSSRGYSSRVIPNAIPISEYPAKFQSGMQPKLLYVRAFSRIYQPQLALYALAKLRTSRPDACLCMVGPDKDGTLQECRSLAEELGLGDSVTFTGMLDKSAWHLLSKKYSIFINTTTKDNMPVSVIEAMALGLPVVSTNPGGIPYLIKDGEDGFLVNVGDVDGMVRAIIRLLDEPGLSQSISANARRKIEAFDWATVKIQWRELLNSVQRGRV